MALIELLRGVLVPVAAGALVLASINSALVGYDDIPVVPHYHNVAHCIVTDTHVHDEHH